ncbi:MAG TPA: cation:proton antiporter [Gemmatimonadales bacterium]|nr:cation:proton antiporter [Gemmatimonadales bacterium]
MRAVASLFALGLMMALFHRVTAGAALEARATLALGFLLLAAFLGGDLAKRARLPRITGFLLAGFAVGPAWLGLLRRDEVEALSFIGDAALALIALSAGSELTLRTFREGGVALARLAGAALVGPFLAVTLVLLTVSPWFPLTTHQRFGNAVAIALTLGAVSAAGSPAVAMGMTTELAARGPVARTLLSVTVLKDVALVLLFTLGLAAARSVTTDGGLNVRVVAGALLVLAGSLAVGVLFGYALSAYGRRMARDTALALLAAAFVAAEAARLAHLETLVVGLAAGFYLETFSPTESERIRRELARGSLLVYLVFFALAGANLRVGALADQWPWVLLLVGLRAVTLRYGLRWAGRDPRVAPALARYGWWGLVPQAGIALWLAQVARRAFPQWGVSLAALIAAMIAVHEVIGPFCFRRALERAGEVREAVGDADAPAGGAAIVPVGGGS